MKDSSLSKIGNIAPYYLAITIPIFIALVIINLIFLRPADVGSKDSITIEIPEETNLEKIADLLAEKSIVRSAFGTSYLLKKAEAKSGGTFKINPGEYELSPALSPKKIIEKLKEGDKIIRTFTIRTGQTYEEVANSIAESGLFEKPEILSAMTKRSLMIKLRLGAAHPEGYFLPGNYTFSRPITAEKVVESLILSSQGDLTTKIPEFTDRAKSLKLTNYDILILASLLEKTGFTDSEKTKISSVYHNRLALYMPLENEKALLYYKKSIPNYTLQESDKLNPGPYNTYVKPSLPATPICNPSLESIRAALFPADTEFLYFFRDRKNELVFSLDEKTHKEKFSKR